MCILQVLFLKKKCVFFFNMDYFLKSFIEFVTVLLLFFVWFFGFKACEILTPRPVIKPAPSALEGEALTAEPPGTSPKGSFHKHLIISCK